MNTYGLFKNLLWILIFMGIISQNGLQAQVAISPQGIKTNSTTPPTTGNVLEFEEGIFKSRLDLSPSGQFSIFFNDGFLDREVLTIDNSFSVGIGTNSPAAKLHVRQATSGLSTIFPSNTILGVEAVDTGFISLVNQGGGQIGLKFGDNQNIDAAGILFDNASQSLQFETGGLPRLTIDTSGYIGINTTSPQAALTINDASGIFLFDDREAEFPGIFPGRIRMVDQIVEGTATADDLLLQADGAVLINIDVNDNGISGTDNGFVIYDNEADTTRLLFMVEETGKVGIGKNPEVGQLEVVASESSASFSNHTTVGVEAAETAYLSLLHDDDTTGEVGLLFGDANDNDDSQIVHNDKGLQFRTGGVVTTIAESGFVGIGTDAPPAALSIDDASGIDFLVPTVPNANLKTVNQISEDTGDKDDLLIQSPGAVLVKLDRDGDSISGDDKGFVVYDQEGESTNQRFIVEETGNVGIGTTPEVKLHIKDGDNTASFPANTVVGIETNEDAFLSILSGSNTTSDVGILFGDNSNNDVGQIRYREEKLQLVTDNTVRLTINDEGDVGIGTTTPEGALTINDPSGIYLYDGVGAEDFPARFRMIDEIDNSGSDPGVDDLLIEADGAIFINVDANGNGISGDDKGFVVYDNETELFIVKEDGKVGIGTDPANEELEVNGDAAKPGGGNWAGLSDRRLKKDIRTYEDGLAEVLQIKPVHYHYNAKSGFPTDEEYIGIIAQEMQKIAPYTVKEAKITNDAKTNYLSFDGTALTYMLVNAIKEQQAQIAQRDAKIEAFLETQKALRTQLETLKALVEELHTTDLPTQRVVVNSAVLFQNEPNPFSENTRIQYNLPKQTKSAVLHITNAAGKHIKEITIKTRGQGIVELEAYALDAGTYFYTLIADGIEIATKQMILTK